LSLAALPEASSQQGNVVIRSSGPQDLRIKNQLLAPIPFAGNGSRKAPPVRASFRYDPARHVTGLAQPAVLVGFAEQRSLAATWVWDCRLQSRYQADGTALHLAVYRIQNLGAPRIRLSMPADVARDQVRGVWIEDSPVGWHYAEGNPPHLQVDLPAERLVSLAVQFTTRAQPLGWRGTLRAALPRAEVPVLRQHWIVWIPPGYESARSTPGAEEPAGFTRRLFGPLARPDTESPWHPLGSGDLPLTATYRRSRVESQQAVERFLRVLGKIAPGADAAGKWETWLHDGAVAAGVPLLIDRPGLVLAGLERLPPLRPAVAEDGAARGAAMLAACQLTLLAHDRALVLTSQASAALDRTALAPLHLWPLWWVPAGPLADRIQEAAGGKSVDGLVPLEAWTQPPASQTASWRLPAVDGDSPDDVYGWTACWAEIPSHGTLDLPYAHRKGMQLLAWVTLFALAGVASLFSSRPGGLLLAAGILGGAALVVPVGWLPLASAAFLALVLCLLLRWVRRPNAVAIVEDTTQSSRVRSTASASALRILLLAALAAQASAAAGAEPVPSKPAKALPTRYDVFIPTDDQGQPTGTKYFVPEGLFNHLHRQATASPSLPAWMITAAEYRAALAWQATPEGLVIERFHAVFHLWISAPRAQVRIPLARAAAELVETETTLDGRPVRVQWDVDAAGVLVDAPGPGSSRLELVLRPAVKAVGSQRGFDLPIPALADSRLDLDVPAETPRLEFPSALGAVHWSEGGRQCQVVLGPTPRLAVAWPGGAHRASGGNRIDVEELLWLKVQPNAVLVDFRFKYKVIEGHLRHLELACDPRLRLQPLRAAGLSVTETQTVAGQAQSLRLDLARPVTDQFVFEGTLLLAGTAPVGNLRLPLVESVGARRTKRWLAVSVDSALGYEEQIPDPLEPVSIPDFLGEWGGELAPHLAYKLPGRTAWGIAIRPRRPQTVADQVLRLSYGPGGADVQFDAELNTTGGYCLQHHIAASVGLDIERISMVEDAVDRVARWATDSDGSVWVFLAAPLSGKHVLSLRGRLPTPARVQATLPQFQMLQAQIASSTIEIFRRPSVNVKITPRSGLIELQSPVADMAKNELGRLVRAFAVDAKKRAAATIHLSPNVPLVRATQSIALGETPRGWRAQAEFRLEVNQGSLERMEVEVPAPASPPYELDPPLPFRVVEPVGQPTQLVVEPMEPIRGRFHLRVSCPLTLASAAAVRVPDVRLRTGVATERLIVLPTRRQGTSLAWETIGLRPIQRPAALAGGKLTEGIDSPATYRVQSEPFRAALRAQPEGAVGGEVRHAEISLALGDDGMCQGVAAFDVLPGTLMECPLQLPAGSRLVQVYVAAQPVTPEPTTEGQWQVPLLLGRLPQRVEVLYTGQLARGGRSPALAAPQLGDLRVRQTLWRIYAARNTRFPAASEVNTLRAELLGLRNTLALAGVDLKQASAEPEELYCWHRLCLAQLARRHAAVDRQLTEATWAGRDTGEPPTAIRAELKAAKAHRSRIDQWLSANAALAPAAQDTSLGPELQALWEATADAGESPICIFGEGWVDRVNVDLPSPARSGWQNPLSGILLGLLLAVLAGVLQFEAWRRWVGHVGFLLVALVGVYWWFFLWPGFVGGLLSAGSLMLWCAERLRRARTTPEGATISVHARTLSA
jgi:hypothetical protein